MKPQVKYLIAVLVVGALGWGWYVNFTPQKRLVADELLYQSPDLELRLLVRYENYPLHYVGYGHSVICKSSRTATSPGYADLLVPVGTVELPSMINVSLVGSEDEIKDRLVAAAKAAYKIQGNTVIVHREDRLWVVSDACAQSRDWSITDDMPTSVVLAESPAVAACEARKKDDLEKGVALPEAAYQCSGMNFIDKGVPEFRNVSVDASGKVSFAVTAIALKGIELRVSSTDKGQTWDTRPVGIVSGTFITDAAGQGRIEMEVAEPGKVVTMEIRAESGGILALYDMGEGADRELGDATFSGSVPARITTDELATATVVVGYSDGYTIERPLSDYR